MEERHSFLNAFILLEIIVLVMVALSWALRTGPGRRVVTDDRARSRPGDSDRAERRAPAANTDDLDEPLVAADKYAWAAAYDRAGALRSRIACPRGFRRVPTAAGSFQRWLRCLPLKPGRPPVRLHDGTPKPRQDAHHAVVDIDVGPADLQQCADAVIRLRAEYLYAHRRRDDIVFRFTSGDEAAFSRWAEGYRPVVRGIRVDWVRTGQRDESHLSLRAYLDTVFTYAGTLSLSRELQPVLKLGDMAVGDVFVRGGLPGHTAIVVDMAANAATGKKAFLLAQSYMPAQDVHVLKNPNDDQLSPWYGLDFGRTLITPEFTFRPVDLMRFP